MQMDSDLTNAVHGPLAWMYDVSRVSGHRTRDIRRIQHSLMVQRQLPKVAEVLNVQVGRHGADEYGPLLEWIREEIGRAHV